MDFVDFCLRTLPIPNSIPSIQVIKYRGRRQ